MYSFPNLEPFCYSMSDFNCCFLTRIQISQEAGQAVWYSHLLKNFPQFFVIHTVKGFSWALAFLLEGEIKTHYLFSWECTVRVWWFASQAHGSHTEPYLLAPWSWTSGSKTVRNKFKFLKPFSLPYIFCLAILNLLIPKLKPKLTCGSILYDLQF